MEKKLNLVLVGITGRGKSKTGNSILNRRVFKLSWSGTREVDYSFTLFRNYAIRVVDTPGMASLYLNEAEDREAAIKNMSTAVSMCCEGVDAFLFVIMFGHTFTCDEKSALDALKRIFGDSFMKHVIVVVTGGDIFKDFMEEEDSNRTFQEWCGEQRGWLQELYTECNGRFVLFNNMEKDEEKRTAQIEEIVKLAEELQTTQGRYTSACFQNAKAERDKLIVELKAPQLRKQFQEEIDLLKADIEKFTETPSPSHRDRIEKRIQSLKEKIEIQDKGYGVLNDLKILVEDVREHLNDVTQLLRLNEELQNIKARKGFWGWLMN